ncbi:acyl carrier protein phosphodiesterase [Marinomonas epiphytica]
MNYFSHLHVAYLTNTSWAGNLLGDFPVRPEQLDQDLHEGWLLHQQVDVMVDAHPASLSFREFPRKGRRRFAGIVQDIVMDYWLIQHWQEFSHVPLTVFCEQALAGLQADKARCPPRLQSMIGSLTERNWLPDLGTQQGVENAILSIMRRWRHGHHLQSFIDEIEQILAQGEEVFLHLYPDLLTFIGQKYQLQR